MTNLAAIDVSVRIGGKTILDGVSISVGPGELLAVLGPNGAGKSTLLSVLSGARSPTLGHAYLDGASLATWGARPLARRRAVLPQGTGASFGYRCFEIVALGRGPHRGRQSPMRDIEIIQAAMGEADVLHLADRIFPTLSGGEQQRVQLARVMAQLWPDPADRDARYLLLDEPTSSLDLAHQHEVLTLARRWAERGAGVLAVLHDLNLAALYADRICVLKDGSLAAAGTPEDVLKEPVIEACFGLPVTVTRHPSRDRLFVIPA